VQGTDESGTPGRAKVLLVDPSTMTVVWTNDPAALDVAGAGVEHATPLTVERIVPMAQAMDVSAALRAVADSGVAQHLRADLVSTAQGRMAIVVSVFRLPDGMLLVLTENAWQAGHGRAGESAQRPARRRSR
jgi:hypothetical protein